LYLRHDSVVWCSVEDVSPPALRVLVHLIRTYCIRMRADTQHNHARTRTHAKHSHMRGHTNTHARTRTHATIKHMHTHSHKRTGTRTHGKIIHTHKHTRAHTHINTHIYAPNTDIHWGGMRSAGSVRTTFANVFYTEGVMGLTAGMPQVCL